jgi:transcriptional regulator with XRE-family HTH domain
MSTSAVEQVTEQVTAELEHQHVSGSELARRMDVSQAFVSRRLSAKVPFNLAELDRVAEVLDVPVEQFLRGAA